MADRRIINRIEWDSHALEYLEVWGLTKENCESVVYFPQRTVLDPYTEEVGHTVVRHMAGDVIVVTGYENPTVPRVLSVFMTIPMGEPRGGSKEPGSTSGSTLPKSERDLRKKILAFGIYTITSDNHPKVVDKDTGAVIFSIPGSASDHRSVANSWKQFIKAHAKWVGVQKKEWMERVQKED